MVRCDQVSRAITADICDTMPSHDPDTKPRLSRNKIQFRCNLSYRAIFVSGVKSYFSLFPVEMGGRAQGMIIIMDLNIFTLFTTVMYSWMVTIAKIHNGYQTFIKFSWSLPWLCAAHKIDSAAPGLAAVLHTHPVGNRRNASWNKFAHSNLDVGADNWADGATNHPLTTHRGISLSRCQPTWIKITKCLQICSLGYWRESCLESVICIFRGRGNLLIVLSRLWWLVKWKVI